MKPILAACLISLLPTFSFAQLAAPPDTSTKPKPFEPILAQEHSGPGRIGVRLSFDKVTGLPTIVGITRGSPALDFGLRIGDVILRIGKNDTTSLTEDEVHLALRGEPGSSVELTIQRDDDPHYIIRAIERRVLPDNAEELIQPPMSEVGKQP